MTTTKIVIKTMREPNDRLKKNYDYIIKKKKKKIPKC